MDNLNCFPTFNALVIPQDCLPLEAFQMKKRTLCYRTVVICWTVTGSTMVPRAMQFQVVLSDVRRQDCLIAARTGSRKTLPIALSILLDDPAADSITITISPLKTSSSHSRIRL
jgi:hypothetical protein